MWNYPFHTLICAHLGCLWSIRRRQYIRGQQASSSVWAAGAQLPSWEGWQGAEPEHLSVSHPWDAVLGLVPTSALYGGSQRSILGKHFPFLLLTALTEEYSVQIKEHQMVLHSRASRSKVPPNLSALTLEQLSMPRPSADLVWNSL